MMINDIKMSLHHFCIILLMLEQHIIDDFFLNQDVDNNKKFIDLCMKFN